jgi:hypothetical protein
MATGKIYFHSPCFDGIVSAVLAWDFLEKTDGWVNPTLRPVNYEQRESWLRDVLEEPSAIVDFLYHPDAQFWADHHGTAFLTGAARRDFEEKQDRRDRRLIYDAAAGSCAALLWDRFYSAFGHRNDRYQELVAWADKIDSARYNSVEEALSSEAPALRLAKGLGIGRTPGYCESVVVALRNQDLAAVAELPPARAHFAEVERLTSIGVDRFQRAARLEDDGIVVFDVDSRDAMISRYLPFSFFPDARYSAGIQRWEGGAKVTAMRNPWRQFESVSLGRIAENLGGGGHPRVGSIVLSGDRAASAPDTLARLLSEIRTAEANPASRLA